MEMEGLSYTRDDDGHYTVEVPVVISRRPAFKGTQCLHAGCELAYGHFVLYDSKNGRVVAERECRHLILTSDHAVGYSELSLANRVIATVVSMQCNVDMTLFSPRIIVDAMVEAKDGDRVQAVSTRRVLAWLERELAGYAAASQDKYKRFYYYYYLLYTHHYLVEDVLKPYVWRSKKYRGHNYTSRSLKQRDRLLGLVRPAWRQLGDALVKQGISLAFEMLEAVERMHEFAGEMDVVVEASELIENTWDRIESLVNEVSPSGMSWLKANPQAVIVIDETLELDPAKDYPFRPSLVATADCNRCKNALRSGDCAFGSERVRPGDKPSKGCKSYEYRQHAIAKVEAGRMNVGSGNTIDARPECQACTSNFLGYCNGLKCFPVQVKNGKCESFRDVGFLCKHAVLHMQYGKTILCNYCKLDPSKRDDRTLPGTLEIAWGTLCQDAQHAEAENLSCYEPLDPALLAGVLERRSKAARQRQAPDDARAHVKVGPFLLSPFGPRAGYYLDMDGWMFHLDSSTVKAILKELGVKVEKKGWASWERDSWRVEGDDVVFDITIGTATRHPERYVKAIPKAQVKETLLQSRCPHESPEDIIVLKDCKDCCYSSKDDDGPECLYSFTYLDPVRLVKGKIDSYVGFHPGVPKAWIRFAVDDPDGGIPAKWIRLFRGLRSGRSQRGENELVKYWWTSDDVQQTITFDKGKNVVTINARTQEAAVGVFAEACQAVHGELTPVLLNDDELHHAPREPDYGDEDDYDGGYDADDYDDYDSDYGHEYSDDYDEGIDD